jgi:crotonobetainyl-CoA:carnitine CoA-transferase CaiB-like acyl-CoA transferase
VMVTLQTAGVPAAAMLRLPELLDDPQLAERGTYTILSHPALDFELPTEATAAPYGRMPVVPVRPAPAAGEHTWDVCSEVLNMSRSEYDELLSQGVLHNG